MPASCSVLCACAIGHFLLSGATAPCKSEACQTYPKEVSTEDLEVNDEPLGSMRLLQMELNHQPVSKNRSQDEEKQYFFPMSQGEEFQQLASSKDMTNETMEGWVKTMSTNAQFQGSGDGLVSLLFKHRIQCPEKQPMGQWQLLRQGTDKIYFSYQCYTFPAVCTNSKPYYTAYTSDVDMAQLENHVVDCPEHHALQGWTIQQEPSKMRIKYDCCKATFTAPENCEDMSTTPNDYASGGTIYLDRHNVQCNLGLALTSWQYKKVSSDQFQISYTCCGPPPFYAKTALRTPSQYDGHGHVVYLDRHNVQCPTDTAMTQFWLRRSGHTTDFFAFECGLIPSCSSSRGLTTPGNDDGRGNMIYLDRHNVECNYNEVMTQWRLYRPTHTTMSFAYTCCAPVKPLGTCTEKQTPINVDGGGNTIYLDRHNVVCDTGTAMQSWRFVRRSHTTFNIVYRCCKSA